MKFVMFPFLVALLVPGLAFAGGAEHAGNGGDPLAAEVTDFGRSISSSFENAHFLTYLPTSYAALMEAQLDWRLLDSAVDGTKVYLTRQILHEGTDEVCALNFLDGKDQKILVNRECWQSTGRHQKLRLAAHEYLGIYNKLIKVGTESPKLDESNYRYSELLVRLLSEMNVVSTVKAGTYGAYNPNRCGMHVERVSSGNEVLVTYADNPIYPNIVCHDAGMMVHLSRASESGYVYQFNLYRHIGNDINLSLEVLSDGNLIATEGGNKDKYVWLTGE
jgi:hypothetical protein